MKDISLLSDWCGHSPGRISLYFTFNNCAWHNTLYLRWLLWLRNSLKMRLLFSAKPTEASQGQNCKSSYLHCSDKYQLYPCSPAYLFFFFKYSYDEGTLLFGLRFFLFSWKLLLQGKEYNSKVQGDILNFCSCWYYMQKIHLYVKKLVQENIGHFCLLNSSQLQVDCLIFLTAWWMINSLCSVVTVLRLTPNYGLERMQMATCLPQ